MESLKQKIRNEAIYMGNGIIKVDGFLNHQIEPGLILEMGQAFKERFDELGIEGVNKIVTAEVSGISPALATAIAYHVPMVFARKHRPITMISDFYCEEAPSRTKKSIVQLSLSKTYLSATDRVILIDDFLATGNTLEALIRLIKKSQATLLGVGCVIEKAFENARELLAHHSFPIESLALVDIQQGQIRVS